MKFLTVVLVLILALLGGRHFYNDNVKQINPPEKLWVERDAHSKKMEAIDPKQMMFEQDVARRMHEKAFSGMSPIIWDNAYVASLSTKETEQRLEREVLEQMMSDARAGVTGAYNQNELNEHIETMRDQNLKSVTAQSLEVAKQVAVDVIKGAKNFINDVASAAQ